MIVRSNKKKNKYIKDVRKRFDEMGRKATADGVTRSSMPARYSQPGAAVTIAKTIAIMASGTRS